MPFSFLNSKKETKEEKIVLDLSEEEKENEEEQEYMKQNMFDETVVFDENYYRRKINMVCQSASNLFHIYKEILKEEITNELRIFNIEYENTKNNTNNENFNNFFIENGI